MKQLFTASFAAVVLVATTTFALSPVFDFIARTGRITWSVCVLAA